MLARGILRNLSFYVLRRNTTAKKARLLFLAFLISYFFLSFAGSLKAQVEFPSSEPYDPGNFGIQTQAFSNIPQSYMLPQGVETPSNNGWNVNAFESQAPINLSDSIQSSAEGGVDNNGANYIVLGAVSPRIMMGSGMYENIPFLNTERQIKQRKLPPLNIPRNDKELIERSDALLKRFTDPKLSIQKSTPGRALRYSLVAGADEVFLSPDLAPTVKSQNDAQTDDSNNALKPMYTLGALCWNIPCANRRMLKVIDNKPVPIVGYGFQTQRGELLAALAYAKIDRNYELRVGDKTFVVQDLIDWEKRSCSPRSNLSLVAIGLAHYSQDPNETWQNVFGETWSLARILEEESQRPVDWSSADSTDKLLAFTYLLARLKKSPNSQQLAETLQRTESFLIAVKKQIWEIFGDHSLSESLFFNTEVQLSSPYMKLYVNGKLLRWLAFVSSTEELASPRMKRAMAELCALVDQLFNSLDNLSDLSATDEESLCVALQTLAFYRDQLKSIGTTNDSFEKEKDYE